MRRSRATWRTSLVNQHKLKAKVLAVRPPENERTNNAPKNAVPKP
jgi:hypothetical protein